MIWSISEARKRLSYLIRQTRAEGPQLITVRDQPTVVVISKAEYQQMVARQATSSPEGG